MRSTAILALELTSGRDSFRALLAGLALIALTSCGGGGGDDSLCSSPRISSVPPTQAVAGQQYVYQVDAAYLCGDPFLIPLTCHNIEAVQLPPGAYAGYSGSGGHVVGWWPTNADAGTTHRFQIATPPDFCGDRATQSWTVNVVPPPPDTTPPTVSWVSPIQSATNVAVNSTITAKFNEPISQTSINSSTFVVSGPAGVIPGTITPSTDSARFTPSGDMPEFSTITGTLTTAIKDVAGNAMTSTYTWSFNTGMGPDITPPTVPTNLTATYVGGSHVTFSWAGSTDDVHLYGYIIRRDGAQVSTAQSRDVMSSDYNLDFNTTYCYTVSALDSSGNESAQSSPLCVTTLDFVPGRVAYFSGLAVPDVLPYIEGVEAIASNGSANTSSGVAVKNDGTVWQWNLYSDMPIQVPNLLDPAAVVGSSNIHFLAIMRDGTVWGWGSNVYGQLGDGTQPWGEILVPVQMLNVANAVSIAGGDMHSLVAESDGSVWAVGVDGCGQLGDGNMGSSATQTTPIQVPTLSNVVAVAAGGGGSLALKADGTVWAWGASGVPLVCDPTPKQVPGLANITALSQGRNYSLALRVDGTVWAWGVNDYGQLGDGTNTDQAVPVQVVGLSDVVAIYATLQDAFALRADGTVWQWGRLTGGFVPVQVQRLSQVKAIAGWKALR